MIANKYKLLDKINEGSFGSVYKAQNIITNEYVAIKFENKYSLKKCLKNEAKIYQYLGKLNGFPQLKTFGTINNVNYLVMDLLGNSLANINNSLSLQNVLVLGIQMIKILESLHNKCLIHRDIKHTNFVLKNNNLYLIDFGFAKRYNFNGIHIEETTTTNIIGSLNFVSLNVHKHIEPSRRDDIESCIYIILLLLFGKLEWSNKTNIEEIIFLKTQLTNIPEFIKNLLYYTRQLKFTEKPNYDFLINILSEEYNN